MDYDSQTCFHDSFIVSWHEEDTRDGLLLPILIDDADDVDDDDVVDDAAVHDVVVYDAIYVGIGFHVVWR